jgi:phenylacetate-CoA ligase
MSFSFDSVVHLYRDTYYKMPQSLKTFLGSIYGSVPLEVRYGKLYTEFKERFDLFEASSEQFKQDFVYNKTLETLIFAEENIPFYKEHFQKHGVKARDYKSLDDLKLFPTISKHDIKANIDRFYTDKVEKPVPYYSGGSLSTPTKYYQPLYTSRAKHKAYSYYTLAKVGYKYRDKTLLLKGREVSKPESNIFWEYEPVDNYLYLSNNYMNSEKFPLMYEQAKKFKPKFVFGYPSAVLSFIAMSRQYHLAPLDIEGVIVSSETIYEADFEEIKAFFGKDVPILADYGHTERVVAAYRLNFDNYHFVNAYGVPRIIDDEIVGTSFDNFVMPFINFKTGDAVSGDKIFFEGTDIAKEVKNIEGRTQDFLVTEDERLVSITTMCGGQHLPLDLIRNLQYRQTEPGKVTVLVESRTGNIDKAHVIAGMKKLVRDGIDFDVEVVDKIEKSARGKRVICKQSLDIEKIRRKQ